MKTANEEIWLDEASRRKRLRKLMALVIFGFVLLLLVLWAMVTQPLLSTPQIDNAGIKVEPSRLQQHVHMLSEVLIPRSERHPEILDRVASYIRDEFEKAKGVVSDQPYQVTGKTYRNVIALFGPDTRERIVIGAHYDSAGERPAADDNASGVAGLIELAYLLQNASLPMRVELVAYTLEEPPYFRTEFMGSAVHANSLKSQGVSVRAMFSLEMIGYFSDAANSQGFPSFVISPFYPSKGNFIAIVGDFSEMSIVRRVKGVMRAASPLPVYSINAPRFVPGIDFSDHLNYWNAGYDAIMITDTSFYRNKNYHTDRDTADTLDYNRMAMVVEGVYATIFAVAQ